MLLSSSKQRQACYSNLPFLKLNEIYVKFVCSLWKTRKQLCNSPVYTNTASTLQAYFCPQIWSPPSGVNPWCAEVKTSLTTVHFFQLPLIRTSVSAGSHFCEWQMNFKAKYHKDCLHYDTYLTFVVAGLFHQVLQHSALRYILNICCSRPISSISSTFFLIFIINNLVFLQRPKPGQNDANLLLVCLCASCAVEVVLPLEHMLVCHQKHLAEVVGTAWGWVTQVGEGGQGWGGGGGGRHSHLCAGDWSVPFMLSYSFCADVFLSYWAVPFVLRCSPYTELFLSYWDVPLTLSCSFRTEMFPLHWAVPFMLFS